MRNGPEDMKYELPGGRGCVNPFLEADQIYLSGLEAVDGFQKFLERGVDSGWVQNSTLSTEDALAVVSQIAVRIDVAIESNGPHT